MPDRSPHQEVAEALKVAIAAWGSLPSGFTVERVYTVEPFVGGWADAAPGKVLVMVSAIDPSRTGNVNVDEVSISVVYLRKLTGKTVTLCDAADKEADLLRVFLTSSTCKSVTVNNSTQKATRINTTLPTPYAAEYIRANEIFAAVIQSVYHLPRVTT